MACKTGKFDRADIQPHIYIYIYIMNQQVGTDLNKNWIFFILGLLLKTAVKN